jgi:hypothetical protein
MQARIHIFSQTSMLVHGWELLYSTLIGANSAPHTLMVTGPGPLDCFRAFFFRDVHVLAGRGLSPFRVRSLFCFFFFAVYFFAVSFSHFLFRLFLKKFKSE